MLCLFLYVACEFVNYETKVLFSSTQNLKFF
jgi:hypothetical protein